MFKKIKQKWKSKSKGFKITVISILLLLLVIRIALPYVVKYYIVKSLNDIEGYEATLEDVDLHLYRGAIALDDFKIYSTETGEKHPLLFVKRLDGSVQWREIFNGSVVGEVYIDQPELSLVTGIETEDTVKNNFKDAEKVSWQEQLTDLFPLTINKLVVRNGKVSYKDVSTSPQIDLTLNEIELQLKNLTNSQEKDTNLFSSGTLSAKLMNHAPINAAIVMDALDEKGTFDLDFTMEDLNLTELNDFTREYANLDIEEGQFSLYAEVVSEQGALNGYVKPVAENMKILDIKEDAKQGVLNVVWQGLVGFGTKIFSNIPKEQLATKVKFEGTKYNTKIATFQAIGYAFVNAFINALNKEIDHTLTPEQLKANTE